MDIGLSLSLWLINILKREEEKTRTEGELTEVVGPEEEIWNKSE